MRSAFGFLMQGFDKTLSRWTSHKGPNGNVSNLSKISKVFLSLTLLFSLIALESKANTTHADGNPRWQILVLIYRWTDFTYMDDLGNEHRVVTSMTQEEVDRATNAATQFFEVDVPALTNRNMYPILVIRYPDRTLTDLDSFCGYWPSRENTSPELDPAFDSVVVIWDASGVDINTGQFTYLQQCGGLAAPNGINQTYATFSVDSVSSNQRNVFKHEWGHSILFYYDAAGTAPRPPVNNHINDTDTRYMHCPTGESYILVDETDDNPIPNSIYNNESGFTHDYYSGTTATPDQPTRCLGITPSAWASGGPVTKPGWNHRVYLPIIITSNNSPVPPNLVRNPGFEDGQYGPDQQPTYWTTDAWQPISTFTWDDTQAHTGSKSVRIYSASANDARWIQTVQVEPNTGYQLTGWIKTENVAPVDDLELAGANLSLYGTWDHTPGLYGTYDWTYVTMQFNSGDNTEVTVACRLGYWSGTVTGTVWCDDIQLKPD